MSAEPFTCPGCGARYTTANGPCAPPITHERTCPTLEPPLAMTTITPAGWVADDAPDDWLWWAGEGDDHQAHTWSATTFTYPEHWEWELIDPEGVVIGGTSGQDPAPYFQRLVDELHAMELEGDPAVTALNAMVRIGERDNR